MSKEEKKVVVKPRVGWHSSVCPCLAEKEFFTKLCLKIHFFKKYKGCWLLVWMNVEGPPNNPSPASFVLFLSEQQCGPTPVTSYSIVFPCKTDCTFCEVRDAFALPTWTQHFKIFPQFVEWWLKSEAGNQDHTEIKLSMNWFCNSDYKWRNRSWRRDAGRKEGDFWAKKEFHFHPHPPAILMKCTNMSYAQEEQLKSYLGEGQLVRQCDP